MVDVEAPDEAAYLRFRNALGAEAASGHVRDLNERIGEQLLDDAIYLACGSRLVTKGILEVALLVGRQQLPIVAHRLAQSALESPPL